MDPRGERTTDTSYFDHWQVARSVLYGVLGMTGEQPLLDTEAFVARVAGVLANEVRRATDIGLASAVGELIVEDYQLKLNPQNQMATSLAAAQMFRIATGVPLKREELGELVATQQQIDALQAELQGRIATLNGGS